MISNIGKLAAIFFTLEFVLLLGVLVLTGTMSTDGQPLKFVSDLAASNGTDPWSIAIAFFVVGTILNLMLLFLMAAFGRK